MDRPPSLRHLLAFDLTARLGTANRAAEAANLSQPAVTKAIAQLERRFGTPLFHRRSTGMYLTAAGEVLQRRVERALQHLALAGRRLAAGGGQPRPLERLATMAQLRALVAVGSTEGFASAARQLGLAQPSVHRAARDLERVVGVPLFERLSHGLVLTQPGRDLARMANLALGEIEAAGHDLAALAGTVTGRVAVGCLPLARTEILPAAVNAVTARFPDVAVSIVEGAYEGLIAALRRGDLDLIVGALRQPPLPADIVQEPLFSDRLCVIARPDHPLAARATLALTDVLDWPWVAPRPNTPARARFEQMFALAGRMPPANVIETGSLVALRGVLMGSDRLAILSRAQVAVETRFGVLTVLPLDLPQTERPIGLTLRSDWVPTPLQTALVAALRVAGHVATGLGTMAPDSEGL
ncbi:MAG: LysR family transcriptional regulator [Alphaproteobacteria bacterium]